MPFTEAIDQRGIQIALKEARVGYYEGGIPIGSVLVHLNETNMEGFEVLGSGHNKRIQKSSPLLHGEMAALESAGRLKAEAYRNSTMVNLID